MMGRVGVHEVMSDGRALFRFWCVHHDRPELGEWSMLSCLRIGPFLTKDEAELLRGKL